MIVRVSGQRAGKSQFLRRLVAATVVVSTLVGSGGSSAFAATPEEPNGQPAEERANNGTVSFLSPQDLPPSSTVTLPPPAAEDPQPAPSPVPSPEVTVPETPSELWSPWLHATRQEDGVWSGEFYTGLEFVRTGSDWSRIDASLRAVGATLEAQNPFVPVVFGPTSVALTTLTLPKGPVVTSLKQGVPVLPRLEGTSRAVYEAPRPASRLVVDSSNNGLKELIVLKDATAPRAWTFHLSDPAHALGTPTSHEDESVTFSNLLTGDVAIQLPAPVAYEGDEDSVAAAVPGSAHQSITAAGDGWDVTLSVDPQWLVGKSYPLVLDPSVNYYSPTHYPSWEVLKYTPGHAGCGSSGGDCLGYSPSSSAVGQNNFFGAGTQSESVAGTYSFDSRPARAVHVVNFSSINFNSTITSATFNLYQNGCLGTVFTCDQRTYYERFYPLYGPVSLSGSTYNQIASLTATSATDQVTVPAFPANTRANFAFPVAATVRDSVQRGNEAYGFVQGLSSEPTSGNIGGPSFAGPNDTLYPHPMINIQWSPPPDKMATPTLTALTDSSIRVNFVEPRNLGPTIDNYTIQLYKSDGTLAASQVCTDSPSGSCQSVTFTGLPYASYYARARAHNSVNYGEYSNNSSTVTLSPFPRITKTITTTPGTGGYYGRGQTITYRLRITNPASTVAMNVTQVSDTLQAGLSSTGLDPTLNGVRCLPTVCALTGNVLTASNFTIPASGYQDLVYSVIARGVDRGCQTISNTAAAYNDYGTETTPAVTATVCESGLGREPWWSYASTNVAAQSDAHVNVMNGNLVVQATDSTPVQARGRFTHVTRRTYNSQDTTGVTLPGSLGLGWQLNLGQADDLAGAGVTTTGLRVPTVAALTAPLGVTMIDRDGTRHLFTYRGGSVNIGNPLDVSSLSSAALLLRPINPTLLPTSLSGTSGFSSVCVDATYQAPAGVHLGLWRYVGSNNGCNSSTQTSSGAAVLGFAAVRPDRVRYDYDATGHLLDMIDGSGVDLRYSYDALKRVTAVYEPRSCTGTIGASTCRATKINYAPATANAYEVTDPAGRLTRYQFDSTFNPATMHLMSVVNPPETQNGGSDHISYTYQGVNSVTCGGTAGQLCSVTDGRGSVTSFGYATANAQSAVASITDRRGTATSFAYTNGGSPASTYVTANTGTHRTRWLGIDASGRVGEIDQGTTSDVYSRVSQYTWDSAGSTCAFVAGQLDASPTAWTRVDNNLCTTTRVNGSGQPTGVTRYAYTPEGVLLRESRDHDSGTPLVVTYANSVQYVRSGGQASLLANDSTLGSRNVSVGDRSGALGTGSSGGDSSVLFALSDRVQMLSPRGNVAGASTSLFRSSYTVANSSTANPNAISSGSCTSRNSGLVCTASVPHSTAGTASTSYTYDSFGQKLSMLTPRGTSYSYQYYGPTSTDLSGSTSADGWLQAVIDPNSKFVYFGYDPAGNTQRTWDRSATAGTALASFTGTGNTSYTETRRATASNKPWRYVLSQRDQLGNTSNTVADANGNATSLQSARGNTTVLTYESGNLLLTSKLPGDSTPTTRHYDQWGNNDWTQDPRGSYTGFTYDAVNRPLKVIRDRGSNSLTTKPTACRLSAAGEAPFPGTFPAGEILCDTQTSYDMHDNVTASTDGDGQVSTSTYDALDRRLTSTLPRSSSLGYTTQSVYDADGNVTDVCPPRQTVETGNSTCTNAGQYSSHTVYDPAGRKSSATNYRAAPAGAFRHGTIASPPSASTVTTSWVYDSNGNLTSVTDPNGHVTTHAYNNLDRKISTTVPRSSRLSSTTYLRYNDAGDLTSTIAPAGIAAGSGTLDLVIDGSSNPYSNPYRIGTGVIGSYRSITLQNGGWLAATAGTDRTLDLKVAESVSICSNCGINLSGQGASGGTPGAGATGNGNSGSGLGPGGGGGYGLTQGGNGGHGGHATVGSPGTAGGAGSGTAGSAGTAYNNQFLTGLQNEIGSGGGAGGNAGQGIGGAGGAGGGAIHLTTPNLLLNGPIVAAGTLGLAGTAGTVGTGGNGGDGSGGGIWITSETITGSSYISTGGSGYASGGVQRVDAVSSGPLQLNTQLGRISVYSYDAAHRRVDTISGATSESYPSIGTATGEQNTRTRTLYDADNHIVGVLEPRAFASSVSNPDRRFQTVTSYDSNGRISDVYTPRLDTSGGGYDDPFNGSASQQCPIASSTGISDYASLSTTRVCKTHVDYDPAGNRSKITYPTAGSNTNRYTAYQYLADNSLHTVDDPDPRTSSGGRISQAHKYTYDGVGRPVKDEQVTSQNPALVTTYTSDGLVATITAPQGDQTHLTTNTYDSNGNLSSVTTQPTAGADRISYTDYYSDNTRYTDVNPAGDTTSWHYDPAGNTTRVYSPAANAGTAPNPTSLPVKTAYYDDNLVKATLIPTGATGFPAGTTHRLVSYGYDTAGRRSSTDADLVTGTDPNTPGTLTLNGALQQLGYFNNDRLATLTGRAGETQSWTYDPAGNQLTGTDSTSNLTTTSSYYLDGLVRSVTSNNRTVKYGYDGAGQVYARDYWTGSSYATQTYTHNDAGIPLSWTNGLAGGTTTASYDDQGRQTSTSGGYGGITTTQQWNPDDTLKSQNVTRASGQNESWNYAYDGMFRLAAANNTSSNVDCSSTPVAGLHCYNYDTASRLSQFKTATATQTAAYDRDGNRTQWAGLSSTYNPDDSLATQATPTGTMTSSYTTNAFGGVNTDTCTTYTYDGFDRLKTRTSNASGICPGSGTNTTAYTYDALNRQTQRTETGLGTSTFRYDGLSNAIAEEATPANALVSYGLKPTAAFDGSAPQAVATSSTSQYLTTDGQGSVTAATTNAGSTTCQMRYDPWGNPNGAISANICTNAGGNTLTDILYRSERRDTSAGTYQLGSRTYDPTKAAFLTPDSRNIGPGSSDAGIGMDPLTRNSYNYVNGNPVNLIDPDGHMPIGDNEDRGIFGHTPPRSGPPARAPRVTNATLQNILDAMYARPGVRSVVGDGTTADALRYELESGNPTGTRGSYHASKALDLVKRIGDVLEADRKAILEGRAPLLSTHERATATAEANRLWGALSSVDRAGSVTADLRADEARLNAFRNTLNRVRANSSLGTITGIEFDGGSKYRAPQRVSGGLPKWTGIVGRLGVLGEFVIPIEAYINPEVWNPFSHDFDPCLNPLTQSMCQRRPDIPA